MPAGRRIALRPAVPGKGFDLLPAPDPGDIFYDIEGDPHVEGGLEYLHGLWAPDTGFRAIWAHDRDAGARGAGGGARRLPGADRRRIRARASTTTRPTR